MGDFEIRKKIEDLIREYRAQNPPKEFIPGKTRIDPSGKSVGSEELVNGIEAVLDGWWTEGRFAKKFLSEFRNYTGLDNVILTNSGSSANLLAIYGLTSSLLGKRRLLKGDEVITVAAAFPTTVGPIVQAGAIPVFLDVEDISSGQYNIDCSGLEQALTEKTKAVFLAHTLGNPFDIDKVAAFTKKNNLWLIEDSCDALGSKYGGKMVGNFGDISTFSFYPAHHITMGEGGAISAKDPKVARAIDSFKNWGKDCWCEPGEDNNCQKRFSRKIGNLPKGYDHKYVYSHLGFNLKSTDMQAAIGLAQLGKVHEFSRRRQEHFAYLTEKLSRYQDYLILPEHLPRAEPAWFGYLISVRKNAKFSRADLIKHLSRNNISTRNLFSGNITKHPCFDNVDYRVVGSLDNTNRIMETTFWIGVQPNLDEQKLRYVTDTFDSFFKKIN